MFSSVCVCWCVCARFLMMQEIKNDELKVVVIRVFFVCGRELRF
jgi:hypothetical protein